MVRSLVDFCSRITLCQLAAVSVLAGPAGAAGPFLYVPNSGSGTVSIVDLSTNAALPGTIPTASPVGSAVRGDGSIAYVSVVNGTVLVIDTATNTATATIGVGSSPVGLAVTPDGTRLYVCNRGSDTVSVIDTATNTVTRNIALPSGSGPVSIAFKLDGSLAYVSNSGNSTVSVLNPATNTVTATISVPAGANQIAIAPDGGHAYVTSGTATTSVIDTTANAVSTTIATVGTSRGVVVRPDGDTAYVGGLDSNDNTVISVINTTTNTVITTISTTGIGQQGLAINPDGTRLYSTNLRTNDVSVIDTATNAVLAPVAVGVDPVLPSTALNGNALLATGRTFIANSIGALESTQASGSNGAPGPIFTGGTLRMNAADINSPLPIELRTGGTIDTSGHDAVLSGVLSGPGLLTKIGDGTLVLSGSNTASGETSLAMGRIQLGAVGALPKGSIRLADGTTLDLNGYGLTLNSGRLLIGTGTVDGHVVLGSGGTINPDRGPFTLTSLDWDAGGRITAAIGGAGGERACVAITGTLTKTDEGVRTIDLTDVGIRQGAVYNLLSFDNNNGFTATDFTVTGVGGGTLTLSGNALTFTIPVPARYGVSISVAKGKNHATFTVTNTGSTATSFHLFRSQQIANSYSEPKPSKPAAKSPVVITYSLGGANITKTLKAGKAATTIPAGASAHIVMKVRPRNTLAFQRTITARIIAASQADSSATALAKTKIVLKPTGSSVN